MEPLNSKDPKSIGGFTLVGRLGKGGMGVVYLASRKSESVALKVIRDSLIDDESEATRFSREAATLEQISSANVARIVDAGVEDGRAWFAAEFVNGPNLSELVNDKGPLDEDQWWDLARGLLNGLADVHKTGTIHRDIKPANLIIAETGPKLIDFGIAHVSDATSVTATGLVAGSPAWFSPEQIEGLDLTPATDVFSAGSVLTFAASGSSPWGGETTMTKASVFKILTSEPQLNEIEGPQRELLELMLRKEPGERPSASSILENLESIRAGNVVELETSEALEIANPRGDTKFAPRSQLLPPRQHGVSRQQEGANTERNAGQSIRSTQRIRNWVVGLTLAVTAGIGLVWVVSNSSGSGQVNVLATVATANPAIGDFSLRLSSSSIEPVQITLKDEASYEDIFSWKSDEPLRISYSAPFSGDENYEATVLPEELGFSGFSNGEELFIVVALEETSTLLSFRSGGSLPANEVYAIRLARGNEEVALARCKEEQESEIATQTSAYRMLYDEYLLDQDAANLDGELFLQYETWSSRIGNLVSLMQVNLGVAENSGSLSPAAQEFVSPIIRAHQQLADAWGALRTSAQSGIGRGNNSAIGWDEAWDSIFAAERSLSSATGVSPSTAAQTFCASVVK